MKDLSQSNAPKTGFPEDEGKGDQIARQAKKFQDPAVTLSGEARAHVALKDPQTLWFNTGTLCNIECAHCYIESSPTNDALVYLSPEDVTRYLDELEEREWGVKEIGFTGGEPFMNPEMITLLQLSLERGYQVLVLTNAMTPMMRPKMRAGIEELVRGFADQLTFRISLDHYSAEIHDIERGQGAFEKSLTGMRWLAQIGAQMSVAGRIAMAQGEAEARAGFAALYKEHGWSIDAHHPAQTVLFPEMDETADVPEITTACWGVLNKSPRDVMCSHSRMIVKRKGAKTPSVLACTLLPYDTQFDLGSTLKEAECDVSLNHPHCAKFCVLGGASCSA